MHDKQALPFEPLGCSKNRQLNRYELVSVSSDKVTTRDSARDPTVDSNDRLMHTRKRKNRDGCANQKQNNMTTKAGDLIDRSTGRPRLDANERPL